MPFKQTFFNVITEDGRNFVLREAIVYVSGRGEAITIPAGAESDGASTPRAIWSLFPPFGAYWKAAFLHDYLYRYTQRPKAECDGLLLEAMESLGVGELEARTIHEGVAIGGEKAFEEDRARQAKLGRDSSPSAETPASPLPAESGEGPPHSKNLAAGLTH